MIVGSKDINFVKLKAACNSKDGLVKFAEELVPTPLRHLGIVVANQRYFVALQVRAIPSFPWKKRKELCEALLSGIRIGGVPDVIYDYSDILLAIDRDMFQQYMEEEERRAEG
jgi:hypothetical protein